MINEAIEQSSRYFDCVASDEPMTNDERSARDDVLRAVCGDGFDGHRPPQPVRGVDGGGPLGFHAPQGFHVRSMGAGRHRFCGERVESALSRAGPLRRARDGADTGRVAAQPADRLRVRDRQCGFAAGTGDGHGEVDRGGQAESGADDSAGSAEVAGSWRLVVGRWQLVNFYIDTMRAFGLY